MLSTEVICVKNFGKASLIRFSFKCIHCWSAGPCWWCYTVKLTVLKLSTNINILPEKPWVFHSVSEIHVSIRPLSVTLSVTLTHESKWVTFVVLDTIPITDPLCWIKSCFELDIWTLVEMPPWLNKSWKEKNRWIFHLILFCS